MQTNAVFPTEAWRGTGPRPTVNGDGLENRSAGACPPRSLDLRENRTLAKAVSLTEARRGTGPRPTVNGDGLANRSAGACPPRSFDPREKRTQTNAVFPIEARRGTGPRPTVKRRRPLSVGQERLLLIRFGSGRSRTTDVGRSAIAGDRPPRYGNRGARGGQAPALQARTKKRGGQAPAFQRITARHYSRCLTSPNVVKARFAGETGPGKRRVRNVSGRPPNETSSI